MMTRISVAPNACCSMLTPRPSGCSGQFSRFGKIDLNQP